MCLLFSVWIIIFVSLGRSYWMIKSRTLTFVSSDRSYWIIQPRTPIFVSKGWSYWQIQSGMSSHQVGHQEWSNHDLSYLELYWMIQSLIRNTDLCLIGRVTLYDPITNHEHWPLSHRAGHTERSSQLVGCPTLWLPRLYTAECRQWHCRTGRMSVTVSLVSASPENSMQTHINDNNAVCD